MIAHKPEKAFTGPKGFDITNIDNATYQGSNLVSGQGVGQLGSMDCLTCGSRLHYSHPGLTEKGLFSEEWVDFLKNRHGELGWQCLQCLGFEHCVTCGAKLGEFDRVINYHDSETGLFCGCEYCADCVLELIRSPAVLSKFETAHATSKQAQSLQENRQYEAAALKFAAAQNVLITKELRNRDELDDLRANILVGMGSCLHYLGKIKKALRSFQRAEKLYDQPVRRGQTNREAAQLKLFAEMSVVIERMNTPVAWCRHVSARICDMVDCMPPRDIEPFSSMRKHFERFHENWLSFAISSSAYDLIPEIIAAVQGRDMVSSIAEHQTGRSELDTTESLEKYIQSRRGLRSMLTSDGQASDRYLKGVDRKLPNTEGAEFNKDFAGLRRALQHSKTEAAGTDDFSILDSPHRAINAKALQSVLSGTEQLLLLFPLGGEGHAVLMSANQKEVSYFRLPALPSLAERCVQYDKVGRKRHGVRRNVSLEDESEVSADDTVFLADPNAFWPQLEYDLREVFWKRLETKINEACTLVVCSAGELHNLSLEPGRPEKIKLMTRLPGLAYFANSRGLLGESLERDHSSSSKSIAISVLADNTAKDIPFAGIEGRLVAALWAGTGYQVDSPSSFPASENIAGFLHVASHGMRKAGLLGSKRSSILLGQNPVGENEIVDAPLAQEAFINVCVGGQCEDSPLDGNPTGLVSGFLRRGSNGWLHRCCRCPMIGPACLG